MIWQSVLLKLQIKAFLRGGDNFPFSAGELEGIAASVNMQNRVVRKLCNSGLRYWVIEFLRRQQKGKKYTALILRFVKDRIASLLLVEVIALDTTQKKHFSAYLFILYNKGELTHP